MRLFASLCLCLCLLSLPVQARVGVPTDAIAAAVPSPEIAAELLHSAGPVTVSRDETGVPGWTIRANGTVIGHIGSTWEIAGSVGYSGRPLDVLVAITPQATIAGARLMAHNEPVLTLGISDEDIAKYVGGFAGLDLTAPRTDLLTPQAGLPDIISRATVSTGVIRDGILRTARTLAIGRGLIAAGGGIDRLCFTETSWPDLLAMGALAHTHTDMTDAAPRAGRGPRCRWSPAMARSLIFTPASSTRPPWAAACLGQQDFTKAIGSLGPGEVGADRAVVRACIRIAARRGSNRAALTG